ncbi:MAG: hypothetical protein ABI605_23875 [Rhizobacter sp.]
MDDSEARPWYRSPMQWALWLLVYGLYAAVPLANLLPDEAAYRGLWSAISSQTSAAWVQAVGSIAAILGAVFVATMQIKETRHQANKADVFQLVKRYVAIRAVASRVALYCLVMRKHLERTDVDQLEVVFALPEFLEFAEYKELVQRFDLVEMPRPSLIESMSSIASYLDRAERAVATANSQSKIALTKRIELWHVLLMQVRDAADTAIEVIHSCNRGLTDLHATHLARIFHQCLV